MWRRCSALVLISAAAGALCGAPAAGAQVRRVGTWNGVPGQYKTVQAAVNAAQSGDWILVGPGDYKESGNAGAVEPAGVLITKPNIHLRGMNRNTVVIDGTRAGAPQCSSRPTDQGALDRNGVEVYMADAAYYIVACQQVCKQVMQADQGEKSALCLSSTNAGGYLQVDNNECDNNKTCLVSNSQNNDDWPSPQIGLCPDGQTGPLGTKSCTVRT